MADTPNPGEDRRREPIRAFDFTRPDKLNREHLRAIQVIMENFARAFATQLASSLRTTLTISTSEVRQRTFEDYVAELENPAYMALLALAPLPGAALFYVSSPVALGMIELSLGAGTVRPGDPRPLSDIERELMKQVVKRATGELQNAFAPVTEIEPRIAAVESNPAFVQIAAPSDTVVTTTFQFHLDGVTGAGSLCMPFPMVQPIMDELTKGSLFVGDVTADLSIAQNQMRQNIDDVDVTVTAEFRPVTLTPAQIIGLQPGDVIPLEHPVDAPLVLRVNGVPIFTGSAGTQGRRVAVALQGPIRSTKDRQ